MRDIPLYIKPQNIQLPHFRNVYEPLRRGNSISQKKEGGGNPKEATIKSEISPHKLTPRSNPHTDSNIITRHTIRINMHLSSLIYKHTVCLCVAVVVATAELGGEARTVGDTERGRERKRER